MKGLKLYVDTTVPVFRAPSNCRDNCSTSTLDQLHLSSPTFNICTSESKQQYLLVERGKLRDNIKQINLLTTLTVQVQRTKVCSTTHRCLQHFAGTNFWGVPWIHNTMCPRKRDSKFLLSPATFLVNSDHSFPSFCNLF